MAERLHFTDDSFRYNAMSASEHLVRYHCVRELCRGKRVLDVACGEGYGSALLAEWGASQVVGIDISIEAIGVAEQVFAKPGVQFLRGDVCRLADVLGDVPPFDLIVSFETIEHVADVPSLLAGIRRYSALDGVVVISCPNDFVEEAENPYHTRRYTFEDFQAITTAILGPASAWMFGTPAHGQVLYPAGDASMENREQADMMLLTHCRDLQQAVVLPAQPNVSPDARTCKFYLGCWGATVPIDAALSPQSYPAFAEPWRALDWFKREREQLQVCQEDLRVAKAGVDRQLADLRRRVLVQARAAQSDLEKERAAREQLKADLDRSAAELAYARAELAYATAQVDEWRAFQQSRSYRLMQVYVRSYTIPIVGPVLRRARRLTRETLRVLRPR